MKYYYVAVFGKFYKKYREMMFVVIAVIQIHAGRVSISA